MNIFKSNFSQAFGKQALMTCEIKQNSDKKLNATLYKMNPNKESDMRDVFLSKQTNCISRDFQKASFDSYPKKEFLMLSNDKTGEVIACSETSRHFRPFEPNSGEYTLIEEAKENKKYKNAVEPLLAFITKQAQKNGDSSIYTAFDEETLPSLKSGNFTKAQTGEYFVPNSEFQSIVKPAEQKYNIQYIV